MNHMFVGNKLRRFQSDHLSRFSFSFSFRSETLYRWMEYFVFSLHFEGEEVLLSSKRYLVSRGEVSGWLRWNFRPIIWSIGRDARFAVFVSLQLRDIGKVWLMGVLTMGSQGGSSNNGKQLHFQPLTRQNSMYSLTLDEVQSQLGDLGKPLSCMNLDELLKNIWTAEANQSVGTDMEGADSANQTALQRQASLTLTGALSKKTVDEVWRDIQQSKNNGERKSREQQPTLGEMALEDFLVKAGVVAEVTSEKKGPAPVVGVDPNFASQFPQHGQWVQYSQPQYQPPQQSMMGVYMPSQSIPPSLHIGPGPVMDVSYPENQVVLHSPLMGTLSDTRTSGRKRGTPEGVIEKTVERRQKRMIKNRESAARSRARKQGYTNELENKVSRLEEEKERLRKQKEAETMLPCAPPPEPKFQLRRTTSASF